MRLLADPDDPGDPFHLGGIQGALAVGGVERLQFEGLGGPPLQLHDHDLAVTGFHHHAVAAAYRGRRRDHDDVAITIDGPQLVSRYFQRIDMFVIDGGEADLIPALADREAAIVETTAATSLSEAQ